MTPRNDDVVLHFLSGSKVRLGNANLYTYKSKLYSFNVCICERLLHDGELVFIINEKASSDLPKRSISCMQKHIELLRFFVRQKGLNFEII